MRKFFTTLKSVVATAIIASMTLAASCSYDDGAINERVDKVEGDLAALTERVAALEKKLNDEVAALKAVLDGNAVVTEVTTDEDGNTTIKLSDGKTITVLTGLQYRVVDGVLELSADGETWVAVSVAPECVVAEVVVNDDNTVTIKLANDEEFTVVKAELIEFGTTRSSLYVLPDQTKEITVTINDAVADINVMNQPLGWKAEIALKPAAEEPEEGAGDNESEDTVAPMPLAAGGTEYVLSITGPAQEFVNAGFAEKEGYITVHFNTESGACKVGKVLVSLAEVTLSVSADGMIHLENTVACEQTNRQGETYVDFADFYIGVIPVEVYAQYGDKSFTANFDDMYGEYIDVAATKRTTGLGNVVDELKQYEEGVTEKEVYDFSVETLAGAFWPVYEFEYGKEYIILVSLEGEMVNYYEHPVLKGAVMDTYKKVLVEAEYVADSATWNDASYKLSLAGFQYYAIGWLSEAEINQYLESGVAETVEELIPKLLQFDNGLMNITSIVSGTLLNETVELSSLADSSLNQWAAPIYPNTKHYFFVYPFNAATEMELWMHKVVVENVYLFGTFETAALTKGEFDPGITYEDATVTENEFSVKAYFGEEVVAYYYKLYPTAAEVEDDRALEIMAYEDIRDFSIRPYCEVNDFRPTYPTYLCIVAVNAAGKYVYEEEKFEPEPSLPATDVEALSAKAYYNIDNAYCTIVDFTLENDEVATVAFRTGDGGWDSDACFTHGFNYINIGEWYDWSNKGESEVWYTNAYLDGTSAEVKGAIVVDYSADGYSFAFCINDYNVTYVGDVEGLDAPENYEGGEPEQPEVTYDYDITFTKCENLTGNTLTFTNDNGYKWVMALTNPLAEGVLKDEAGNWDGNSTTIEVPGAEYPGYCYSGTFTVTKDGDNYAISFITDPWINGVKSNCRFAFNGPVEAPSSSGPDLTGYEEGTGASVDYKSEYGTVRFKLTYIDEVVLQIYPFYGNEPEVHFTVGTSQVETLTLSGLNAESGTVDLYQQADGSYLVMVDATFQQVGAKKFYFYVTL